VTVAHFVPSMLRAFLDDPAAADAEKCRSLRLVIASGEALPRIWRSGLPRGSALPCTTSTARRSLDRSDVLAVRGRDGIGSDRPSDRNVRIQVIDPAGELAPIGQPGSCASAALRSAAAISGGRTSRPSSLC